MAATHQMERVIEKLEEIRRGLIDVETAIDNLIKARNPEPSSIYGGWGGGEPPHYVSVNGRVFRFETSEEAKLFEAKVIASR